MALRTTAASAAVTVAALLATAACSHDPSGPSTGARTGASTAAASTNPAVPSGQRASAILLDASDKERLRQDSPNVHALIAGCDEKSTYQARPVADLNAGRHYSSDGANAPDKTSKVLEADSQQAYALALCYLATGRATYAASAQKIIDAWVTTLRSASTISGKDNLAFFMTPMTPAAAWVRGVNGWSGDTYADFLRNVGLPNTKPVIEHKRNHGLWGVWYQSSAAAYLGDSALLTQTRARWQELMQQEVAADGTMTDEIQRSDSSDFTGGPNKGKKGLAYTNYAMLPATLAAKTFADQGTPVWDTAGGVLLGKAYAKAAAWIVDPSTFPYYASNHGQLEGVTTASYAAILQRHYPNDDGAKLLSGHTITGDAYQLTTLFPAS